MLMPPAGLGQQALLCLQTLSGPDLELHASNTTFLSTNASQDTVLPAHSGLSLFFSAVGPDNSSWGPVVSFATVLLLLALAPHTHQAQLWSPYRPQGRSWLATSSCGTSWHSTASSMLWPGPFWLPYNL